MEVLNRVKKIEDISIIEKYYNKLKVNNFFKKDIKNYIEFLKFDKNEYLCREGDEISNFMIFIDGKAKVFKTLPNGKTFLLAFYRPIQVIGDMEIIKNQVASSTIQALSECYCLSIPMEKARYELTADSEFLKFICESLAEKLSVISINSSINLLYPLENRLASYINELPKLVGDKSEKEYIDFDENLIEIAELLGSSYRHLLRTLNNLIKKGVLEKDSAGYIVVNKELLKKLAGDLYTDTRFHSF